MNQGVAVRNSSQNLSDVKQGCIGDAIIITCLSCINFDCEFYRTDLYSLYDEKKRIHPNLSIEYIPIEFSPTRIARAGQLVWAFTIVVQRHQHQPTVTET